MRLTARAKYSWFASRPRVAGVAGGLAVVVVEVDQVDVARHVELARAELAHAHDPELRAPAVRAERRAVHGVELGAGVAAGDVERELGQLGDRGGDHGQRRLLRRSRA